MSKKILSMLFVLTFSPLSTADDATYKPIHRELSELPRFWAQDREEPEEENSQRLEVVSKAISKAAKNHRPLGVSEVQMQAALMTVAYRESVLAKNVGIGRCDLMPKGQRCDNGRAKTYFQLWEVSCPAVWKKDLVPGSQEELDIAAVCAAKLLTHSYKRCLGKNKNGGAWAGAFAGYRSVDCNWDDKEPNKSPVHREKFMYMLQHKLSK